MASDWRLAPLAKLELDERREAGKITKDRRIVNQIVTVFVTDWKANRG